MKLKEIIQEFDFATFQEYATKGQAEALLLKDALLHRGFALSELKGIDGNSLDRKLLHSWKKKDLLPFEIPAGWGRLNVVELVWLRLLMELRALGVSLDRIMDLKRHFFDNEVYLPIVYENAMDRIRKSEANDPYRLAFMNDDGSVISFEDFCREYVTEGTCRLLDHIQGIVLNRHVFCLRLTVDGKFDFFELEALLSEQNSANAAEKPAWYKILNDQSCVLVNLTSIISEITQTHEVFKVENEKIAFKKTAQTLIRELFNEKEITEISIRLTNKDEPLLLVKRELSYRDLDQRINSLQKRGVFKDLSIKTRDGKVCYFESIDLIKL